MRYLILRAAAGLKGDIEISEERYNEVRAAKAGLLLFLGIEEKSNILLDNFGEYEKTLIGLIVDRITYYDNSLVGWRSDMMQINRRLTNVLSSAKLYIDQMMHDAAMIFGDETDGYQKIKSLFSEAYDSSFAYRVMEAVRNYIQHRAFPVHALSYPHDPIDPYEQENEIAVGILPKMLVERLEKDPKFKRSVLSELRQNGEEIAITPLLREYVGCLGEIQNRIRQVCNPQFLQWEETLNSVIAEAENFFEDKPTLALAVVKEVQRGRWPEIEYIFSEVFKLRKKYEKRNYMNRGRARSYASGATIEKL